MGLYVEEAVESVLKQTFRSFDIVVVDDGSTDETTSRALERLASRGIPVLHQANLGVSQARNTGITAARGRYICCLDADDRLEPTYFEKAVRVLERSPDVGFVTSYYRHFGESDDEYRWPDPDIPNMLTTNTVTAGSVFRREAWRTVGGFCNAYREGVEDWHFWLSLLEAGYRGEIIPEVLFHYCVRGQSLSSGMYRPATFGKLIAQLAADHESSYRAHLPAVLGAYGTRWAQLKAYLSARDEAIRWLQGQLSAREEAAREHEQANRDLRAHVHKLEEDTRWFEEQRTEWRTTHERQVDMIRRLRAQLDDGAETRRWLEEQRVAWQATAELQDRMIRDLQAPVLSLAVRRMHKRVTRWTGVWHKLIRARDARDFNGQQGRQPGT
jgi:glycosyltransferase involved in cell wall biosynthesis